MIPARRLVTDSRIKAVLPASPLENTRMRKFVADGMGLLGEHYGIEPSELANHAAPGGVIPEEERAAELNSALHSRDNDAIIAARGGFGCLRLLPLLDLEACRNHPKLLIGFSDITILQMALFQKTGVPSLSGPMLMTLTETNLGRLLPLLATDATGIDLIPAGDKKKVNVLQPGKAEGVLLGGNLFSLVQMLGTGFLPRLDNAIFFFEDVNETVDHIDSFLTHLKLVGQLYKVAGVVIGDISWRHEGLRIARKEKTEAFRRRIAGLFRKEVPVVMGVDYGHIDNTITIPIGVRAELDTDNRSLTLIESVTHG